MKTRLRQLRKSYGQKQKQLADLLGVSQMQISRYESGKQEPDIKALIKLANYYGVTIDYLVGRDDE